MKRVFTNIAPVTQMVETAPGQFIGVMEYGGTATSSFKLYIL